MRSLIIALAVLVLASCAPRGETRSLDEVLKDAQSRFETVYSVALDSVNGDIKAQLESVTKALDGLVGHLAQGGSISPDQLANLRQIQTGLNALVSHAGYTSRPALSEISKQYQVLVSQLEATGSPASIEAGTLKLAAMRAYTVLAGELETTKFAL